MFLKTPHIFELINAFNPIFIHCETLTHSARFYIVRHLTHEGTPTVDLIIALKLNDFDILESLIVSRSLFS